MISESTNNVILLITIAWQVNIDADKIQRMFHNSVIKALKSITVVPSTVLLHSLSQC